MLEQNISILGCGWLGMPLAFSLTNKGYHLKGSMRSDTNLFKLKEKGVEPFVVDISKRNIEIVDFLFSDIIVIAITSKNILDYEKLIERIEQSTIRKVIFISSTSVYPYTNDTVTENSPTKKTLLSEIEQLFRVNTTFQTTIIRFGGLFGYNRKPGNFIKQDKLIPNPEGYINFIHRDDCIQIIEQVVIKDILNTTLNACADSHPRRRDFYIQEVQKTRGANPLFDEKSSNEYKIVSSEKLKSLLDYQFKYSDLMLGWE